MIPYQPTKFNANHHAASNADSDRAAPIFNSMKHIAAYLLAVLGGKTAPTAADVSAILASVGVDADSAQLNKVIAELDGKNVEEVIAEGMTKLASVPSGGAAAAAAPAAGGAAAEAVAAPVEEEKEESDDDMGFGLFD
ncbi:60S acidic ribosomal protein P2 [Allomyces arbusculus]|nr:60S acidic ribosomal protein P2 [Allomyces arbusculus]